MTAIQQDVEEEVVVVGNSARNEALESISERAREERDKELAANDHPVVDTSGKEDPKEEKEEENGLQEEAKASEEVKEEPKEEAKPETVKIKVDGEEREVPKDKILEAGVRAMQKESAADKRLEEATRLLREVQTKYVAPQTEAAPPQWDDQTINYALQHGDEDQKAYAAKLWMERQQATPNIIKAQIMDEIEGNNATEWFASEYSDIVKDPYLLRLAVEAENDALRNGDTRPRKERYKQFGDDLRAWKGGTTQTLTDKQTKKSENVISLPTASVKREAQTEEKPKTASDIIEDMRKSRGQR